MTNTDEIITFDKFKLIIFDLDGTIVKLKAEWHELKSYLSDLFNTKYKMACTFKSISECLSKLAEMGNEKELQNFFSIIEEYEYKNIEDTDLIEETIFFIKHKELFGVNKDAKIAILSLNTRKTIHRSLEIAGLTKYIEYIVGREDVRHWKPNPEGLLKIMAYFNVNSSNVVYIGDLEKDKLTAINANVKFYNVKEIIKLVRNSRKI
ncbi:MAG: HAD family hydrolase [Promethearchaeota archaeon]